MLVVFMFCLKFKLQVDIVVRENLIFNGGRNLWGAEKILIRTDLPKFWSMSGGLEKL